MFYVSRALSNQTVSETIDLDRCSEEWSLITVSTVFKNQMLATLDSCSD